MATHTRKRGYRDDISLQHEDHSRGSHWSEYNLQSEYIIIHKDYLTPIKKKTNCTALKLLKKQKQIMNIIAKIDVLVHKFYVIF